jgi:hypothetical protein
MTSTMSTTKSTERTRLPGAASVSKLQSYDHPPIGAEIQSIGGHYEIVDECLLGFGNRRVLYHRALAELDNSCCGVMGCSYAIVVGFVEQYDDRPISDPGAARERRSIIEPISDQRQSAAIRDILLRDPDISQVVFSSLGNRD